MLTSALQKTCGHLLAVLAAANFLNGTVIAQCYYTYTPIPNPPGWQCRVMAINNHGAVAGYTLNAGETTRAFVWTPEGGTRVLSRPPGIISMEATDINDHGVVCGTMRSTTQNYGFVWDGATVSTLPMPDWVAIIYVTGINNAGVIAGSVGISVGPWRACAWVDGQFVDLASQISAIECLAQDISQRGEIIGWGFRELIPPLYPYTGFRWDADGTTWFAEVPASRAEPRATNNNGVAVGRVSWLPIGSGSIYYSGAIWDDQGIAIIESTTQRTIVEGVNDAGRAVGWFEQQPNNPQAFVWQNGVVQLLEPITQPPQPFGMIRQGMDINNRGQIAIEYPAVLTPVWTIGDVTGDCLVTLEDLSRVLSEFGTPINEYPRHDVDVDGDVDLTDLALVLTHLGE